MSTTERTVTVRVALGDGAVMVIPDPNPGDGRHPIEWALRYGKPDAVRYQAAELIDSYDYLLSGNINMTEATRRLRLLRKARRMCAQ